MKKHINILLIVLCMCTVLFCMVITFSRAAPADKKMPTVKKIQNSNYFISRYVVGSGGLTAVNAQNFHTATAGEMVIGSLHNDKCIILSGFWAPQIFAEPSEIGTENNTNLPASFKLYQNYPNPFNPITTIEYDLPRKSRVTIEIFNTMGQRIRILQSKTELPGHYRIMWDARDDYSHLVGSGLYFYQLTANSSDSETGAGLEFQEIMKMIFIK
ncbi:T9SS type A sorting domain-containing protein [candidate division KSB1 bacterium]|nr:T9SS type A sorting domain-containing protein [candidate division KSB1 bacterium]